MCQAEPPSVRLLVVQTHMNIGIISKHYRQKCDVGLHQAQGHV